MDLEQIDILKGPQSLYFGKSASAGVISFKSADPGDEFEARLGGGYDFEMEGYYFDGAISGPITDTLGARLAVRYADTDEIWENSVPGRSDQFSEEDLNARLTVVWAPTDALNINWKTTVTTHEADDAIGNTDIKCTVPGDPQESVFPAGLLLLPPGYDCDDDDGVSQLAGHNQFVRQNFVGHRNLQPFEELDTLLSRVQIDWDINENLTLTSVTAYFELEEEGAASSKREHEYCYISWGFFIYMKINSMFSNKIKWPNVTGFFHFIFFTQINNCIFNLFISKIQRNMVIFS